MISMARKRMLAKAVSIELIRARSQADKANSAGNPRTETGDDGATGDGVATGDGSAPGDTASQATTTATGKRVGHGRNRTSCESCVRSKKACTFPDDSPTQCLRCTTARKTCPGIVATVRASQRSACDRCVKTRVGSCDYKANSGISCLSCEVNDVPCPGITAITESIRPPQEIGERDHSVGGSGSIID
jgi:hypothetical protein